MNAGHFVTLTAYWGNDDAEGTIQVSNQTWMRIKAGARHEEKGQAFYEGSSFPVVWSFIDGCVTIFGDDGMEGVVDFPVNELNVYPSPKS